MTLKRIAKKAIPTQILNPPGNKTLKVSAELHLPFQGFLPLWQSKTAAVCDLLYPYKMRTPVWGPVFSHWSSTQPFQPPSIQIQNHTTRAENNFRNMATALEKIPLSGQGKNLAYVGKMYPDEGNYLDFEDTLPMPVARVCLH